MEESGNSLPSHRGWQSLPQEAKQLNNRRSNIRRGCRFTHKAVNVKGLIKSSAEKCLKSKTVKDGSFLANIKTGNSLQLFCEVSDSVVLISRIA